MQNLNLRNKIYLSYLFSIIILILISYQAFNSLTKVEALSDKAISESYKSVFAAQSMLKVLERHKSSEWMLIAGKHREADRIFIESRDEFFNRLGEVKINARLEGEADLIKKIEDYYYQYLDLYKLLEKYTDLKDKEKITFYSNAIRWQLDKLTQDTLTLLEMNRQSMFEVSTQVRDLSKQYIGVMIIFSFIGVVIAVVISFWLANVIISPIENLKEAVAEVRKGNFDVYIKTDYTDEIGILATEFSKMKEQIKGYRQLNLEKLMDEKKQTEAILKSVGDSMIVIDPDYKIIMVNPTAERIFYLLPGMSQGRDFREVIKSDELFKIIKTAVEKKNTFGRSLPTFEWEYDRVKRHYQVKVFDVEKEDNQPIAYVILLEDVTKLKELDQMKSDFISIASHELRTPLTSIIMSLGMVVDGLAGPLNDDQKELLKAADEDAKRMRQLMTNLLDISRIETGRMEMDFSSINPATLTHNVYSSFNTQAQSQKIKLIENIEDNLPNVLADSNRILQVFNNLVGNALRYTPENGTITISASKVGSFIKFSVADTGRGIPKEFHRKIFQKFVQVEDDPNRGSAGLGLALAYEIVRSHHGSIWVESEPERGAKFSFTLPIAEEEDLKLAGKQMVKNIITAAEAEDIQIETAPDRTILGVPSNGDKTETEKESAGS